MQEREKEGMHEICIFADGKKMSFDKIALMRVARTLAMPSVIYFIWNRLQIIIVFCPSAQTQINILIKQLCVRHLLCDASFERNINIHTHTHRRRNISVLFTLHPVSFHFGNKIVFIRIFFRWCTAISDAADDAGRCHAFCDTFFMLAASPQGITLGKLLITRYTLSPSLSHFVCFDILHGTLRFRAGFGAT